ncbi:MAG: hypothetical protein QME66_08505 [Candidatus Eisenbacteria bacterium]|nr:hypothetical protein [Candidatus Eisenbacteria bacterium]
MNRYVVGILAVALTLSLILAGCENNPTNATTDANLAKDKVTQANAAFESLLFTLISTEFAGVSKPSHINLQPANSLYKQALALDPNNLDANFGAALTEILILTSDATVNATWDRWKAYIDTADVPFSVPGTMMKSGPFGLPRTGFPLNLKNARISPLMYPGTAFGMAKLSTQNPPQMHELQDILKNQVLPKVDYALARLVKVETNSSYTFTVTPKMQGDVNEDPLELDLTEIYSFEAMLNLARSFILVATAYNFDFASYDSAGWIGAMTQSSEFLGLKTGGATQMSDAKEDIIAATNRLDDAVAFLKAEIDNQSDDIIKKKTATLEGPSSADLDSILAWDDRIRDYLTNPQVITEDFDGNSGTPPVAVTFDLGKFFTNPITNLKGVFPAYTVEVERDTTHRENWTWNWVYAAGNFDYQGSSMTYYNYSKSCWWDRWSSLNCSQPGDAIPRFDAVFDSIIASFQARSDITSFNVWANWWGSVSPGPNWVWTQIYYNYNYEVQDRVFYVPVIVWNANSFAAWTFPNPTFNGLLPGMTTDALFKTTFGITSQNWQTRNSFAGMFGR